METIIFIIKLIAVIIAIIGYLFFMVWWLTKTEKEQFDKIFKYESDENKQKVKAIKRVFEDCY